jgi:hypothetical protein
LDRHLNFNRDRDYALHDPTDVSVETLIEAVRRGYSEYVPRLMGNWILASSSVGSEATRSILDGFASISDVETAKQILQGISPNIYSQCISDPYAPAWDTSIDSQVWRELFTPLWWRLPVETSIAVTKEPSPSGFPPRHVALRTLAEDFLGLRYDPDAELRRPETLMLRHEPEVVTFEQRSGAPPIAFRAASLNKDGRSNEIGELTQELIQNRFVVTTGFLGDYEPETACIVLYDAAIDAVATELAIPRRSLATITLLHQTIHALAHLGRDLDEARWHKFALPSAASSVFEPDALHAAIAQYFSYRFLLHLGDPALLHGFKTLSDHQPPAYQAWRRMKSVRLENMRGWLMSVRRGVPDALSRMPVSEI